MLQHRSDIETAQLMMSPIMHRLMRPQYMESGAHCSLASACSQPHTHQNHKACLYLSLMPIELLSAHHLLLCLLCFVLRSTSKTKHSKPGTLHHTQKCVPRIQCCSWADFSVVMGAALDASDSRSSPFLTSCSYCSKSRASTLADEPM